MTIRYVQVDDFEQRSLTIPGILIMAKDGFVVSSYKAWLQSNKDKSIIIIVAMDLMGGIYHDNFARILAL